MLKFTVGGPECGWRANWDGKRQLAAQMAGHIHGETNGMLPAVATRALEKERLPVQSGAIPQARVHTVCTEWQAILANGAKIHIRSTHMKHIEKAKLCSQLKMLAPTAWCAADLGCMGMPIR